MVKIDKEHAMLAFVLHECFHYTQEKIAQLMGISQSTVSNIIKEIRYQKQIYDLEQEIEITKQKLAAIGYTDQLLSSPFKYCNPYE